MAKKQADAHVAYQVRCSCCGFVGWSAPADSFGAGLRPYVRACLTTRGKYPTLPDLFICTECKFW